MEAVLQVMYRLIVLTGCRMYPRYLAIEFRVRRRRRIPLPRIENPQKILLYKQVLEFRRQGYSYPAIARQLGISVGTVWNYANIPSTRSK